MWQLGFDFVDESGALGVSCASGVPLVGRDGVAVASDEDGFVLGAGEGGVEDSAGVGDLLGGGLAGVVMWEQSFDEAGQDDDAELAALGAVVGGQGDVAGD
ncbi:hypothetical protein M8J74_33110 [Streptomyces panaciradicis]|nr:hypothetical protein [Streptomyces panaciradicis]MCL6673235.1 hypothetical protein [Streptomyces panaciradicis]